MPAIRTAILVLLGLASLPPAPRTAEAQQPPAAAAPSFTPQEQQARQAVFDSDQWKAVRSKFDKWLSQQAAYDDAGVAGIKQELQSRIAAMRADQLRAFMVLMDGRLDVLLSPEATAARDWADEFYTAQGRRTLAAKYGAADPVHMTAQQLQEALDRFASDRQNQGAAQAAFQESQAAQLAGASALRKAQEAAAPAQMRPATFGTPYAPPARAPRPQRYEAPYDPPRYSIGPWGGVWVGF